MAVFSIACGVGIATAVNKTKAKTQPEQTYAATVTEINNANDLMSFRNSVNAGNTYYGVTINLNWDIDFGDINVNQKFGIDDDKVWTPIGTMDHKFQGTFDGKNNTIRGLTIRGAFSSYEADNEAYKYLGFFGVVGSGAKIMNLRLTNIKIIAGDSSENGTHVEDLFNNGYQNYNPDCGIVSLGLNAGILAGYLHNPLPHSQADINQDFYKAYIFIENCTVSNSRIYAGFRQLQSNALNVGGLIGGATADSQANARVYQIKNCTANVNIKVDTYIYGNRGQHIGGIAGILCNTRLENCYYTGELYVFMPSSFNSAGVYVSNIGFYHYEGFCDIINCEAQLTGNSKWWWVDMSSGTIQAYQNPSKTHNYDITNRASGSISGFETYSDYNNGIPTPSGFRKNKTIKLQKMGDAVGDDSIYFRVDNTDRVTQITRDYYALDTHPGLGDISWGSDGGGHHDSYAATLFGKYNISISAPGYHIESVIYNRENQTITATFEKTSCTVTLYAKGYYYKNAFYTATADRGSALDAMPELYQQIGSSQTKLTPASTAKNIRSYELETQYGSNLGVVSTNGSYKISTNGATSGWSVFFASAEGDLRLTKYNLVLTPHDKTNSSPSSIVLNDMDIDIYIDVTPISGEIRAVYAGNHYLPAGVVSNPKAGSTNAMVFSKYAGTTITTTTEGTSTYLNISFPEELKEYFQLRRNSTIYMSMGMARSRKIRIYKTVTERAEDTSTTSEYVYPKGGYCLYERRPVEEGTDRSTPVIYVEYTRETNYLCGYYTSGPEGARYTAKGDITGSTQVKDITYAVIESVNLATTTTQYYYEGYTAPWVSSGWILSSNREHLLNQGITHIKVGSTYKDITAYTQADLTNQLTSMANGGYITLYKMQNGYEIGKWIFETSSIYATEGDITYYNTLKLAEGSFGSLTGIAQPDGAYLQSYYTTREITLNLTTYKLDDTYTNQVGINQYLVNETDVDNTYALPNKVLNGIRVTLAEDKSNIVIETGTGLSYTIYPYTRIDSEDYLNTKTNLEEILSHFNLSWQYQISGSTVWSELQNNRALDNNMSIRVQFIPKEIEVSITAENGTVGETRSRENPTSATITVLADTDVTSEEQSYSYNGIDYPKHIITLTSYNAAWANGIDNKAQAWIDAHNYTLQASTRHSAPGEADYYIVANSGYKFNTPSLHYTNTNVNVDEFNITVYYTLDSYTLPLYYNIPNSPTFTSQLQTFNVIEDTPLLGVEVAETDIYKFANWIILADKSSLISQGITHINNLAIESLTNEQIDTLFNNEYITLTKDTSDKSVTNITLLDRDNWILKTSGRIFAIDNKIYYVVTSLMAGSYGTLNPIEVDENTAYIRAKWSKEYNILIDNTKANSIHEENTNWYGAGSVGTAITDNGNNTLSLDLKDSTDYNYRFFTNNLGDIATAYFTKEDYANNTKEGIISNNLGNSWYIYNYGYEIKSWKITFSLEVNGNVYNYCIYVDNAEWAYSKWETASNVKRTEVSALTGTLSKMASYLESLTDWTAFTSQLPQITLTPEWTATEITPTAAGEYVLSEGGKKETSLKYGEGYSFRYNPSSIGQSLVYYLTPNGDTDNSREGYGVILPSADAWNYRNLSHTEYNYEDGKYLAELTPVYLENIYKVTLNGIKEYANNYVLSLNSSYAFTEYNYTYDVYSYVDYPYQNDTFSYTPYNHAAWVEEYTSILSTFRLNYNEATTNATLAALRKVYNTATVELGEQEIADTTHPSLIANGDMYIYLANGQETGVMPAFVTNYYTLIFWHNTRDNLGEEINYAYYTDLIDLEAHKSAIDEYTKYTTWSYKDTYRQGRYNCELNAYYFRDYYYLQPELVLDSIPGEYGYLTIGMDDVIDGSETTYFLVINIGGTVYNYKADNFTTSNWGTYWHGLISLIGEVEGEERVTSLNNTLTAVDKLKIYAGCDLYLDTYDQSKDIEAVSSGHWDNFIGYRYLRQDSVMYTGNEYNKTLTSEEIQQLKDEERIETAGEYPLTIEFEKIPYNLVIEVEEGGTFSYTHNRDSVTGIRRAELTVTRDDVYTLTYYATLGYEFGEVAYRLILPNGAEKALVTYAELKRTNGTVDQRYTLNLTGTFLRTNYYSDIDYATYSVEDSDLGILDINTEKIVFTYKVKVLDSSKASEAYIDEIEIGRWQVGERIGIASAFSEIASGYGYKGAEEYAVLNSYAYVKNNPNNRNYMYRTYPFILKEKPSETYTLDSTLGVMLNAGAGSIIPEGEEARTVYTTIEVRKLIKIEVEVYAEEYDPNDTVREITLTNTSTNSTSIKLHPESEIVDGKYTTTAELYSYNGLMNMATVNMDNDRYTGVVYRIGDSEVATRFTLEEDATLEVHLIPRTLEARVRYYLNGEERESLQEITLSLEAENNLHLNSTVNISYQLQADYLVTIEINKQAQSPDGNSITYKVQGSDYAYREIGIAVYVRNKPTDKIDISYRLEDSTKSLLTDNYGNLIVRVGDDEESYQNKVEGITVIADKPVEVELSLNAGYEYSGRVQFNNNAKKSLKLEGNKLQLIESFRVGDNGDAGSYIIYLRKREIKVHLQLETNSQNNYTIDADRGSKDILNGGSEVEITGYVGITVNITRLRELEREEPEYYYYLDKSKNEHKLEGALVVTSELIEEAGETIEVRVKSATRYKVEISISGVLPRERINIEGVTEGYYKAGSKLSVSITTEPVDKYNLTLRVEGEEWTGEGITAEIEIDKDKTLNLRVEAKAYPITYHEYHYDNLSNLGQEVDESEVEIGNINTSGERYEEQASISLNQTTPDYQLTKLKLIGESEIELNLEDNRVIVQGEGTTVTERRGSYEIKQGEKTYYISIQNNRIVLTYTTTTTLTLHAYYTSLKLIQQY